MNDKRESAGGATTRLVGVVRQLNQLELPLATGFADLRARANRHVQINDRAFEYYPRLERVRRRVCAALEQPISLAEAARIAGNEQKLLFDILLRESWGRIQ